MAHFARTSAQADGDYRVETSIMSKCRRRPGVTVDRATNAGWGSVRACTVGDGEAPAPRAVAYFAVTTGSAIKSVPAPAR